MFNKLDSIISNEKLNDLLTENKIAELIRAKQKKDDPIEEKKHSLVFALAIVGAVAAVAAIAYAVYRFVTPKYIDDFEDDFDDDFNDDTDDTDNFSAKSDDAPAESN